MARASKKVQRERESISFRPRTDGADRIKERLALLRKRLPTLGQSALLRGVLQVGLDTVESQGDDVLLRRIAGLAAPGG